MEVYDTGKMELLESKNKIQTESQLIKPRQDTVAFN